MHALLTVLLALAVAVLGLKVWNHRRATRRLNSAVSARRTLLREDLPEALGRDWDVLCDQVNDVVAELNRLQHLRTGQLAQLEATLGSLQEAVLIVDSNNYILLANKALHDIFPRAVNTLGQRLELVLQSAEFLAYVDRVRQGDAAPQRELEFVDGTSSTWVEVTGTSIPPLNGPKGPWALFVLHDITRQKRLELVRKEFVANVSHELRTPLSVIKGYVETLVDGGDEVDPQDRTKFLRTIQRHTDRLNSLLEDLLTLSRLESVNPGLAREPVTLVPLIEGIVDDYRHRPAAAGHTIDFSADLGGLPPTFSIDPLKITQVMENLLDNAVKYTPGGSHLQISVRPLPTAAEICVRDNGPGIPADDLPHLFERFYRVEKGRAREKGGTGLGLSIVKHIVQLHGGRVWVESQMGKGSAFFFSLPAPQASPPAPSSP
jgi:two-component system, OmpR family, phosphate regulon sensor histidine kinase PhoR